MDVSSKFNAFSQGIGLMSQPVLTTPNATVTSFLATIKGQEYHIDDIQAVSSYDEGAKARRWLTFGAVGTTIVLVLTAVSGGAVLPGPLFLIPLALGGAALLIQFLWPAAGTGLVLTMKNGKATIVNGLSRTEIADLRATIEKLLPPEDETTS